MSRIDPTAIPGRDLDPDAVEAAADELARGGVQVREIGADVVREWRTLANHYEAPEAPRLLTAMNPVETGARQFGDDVEKVAGALRAYAEETRPIKAALASVRSRAWDFVSRANADPEWQYKQSMVDENTQLVREVNGLQVQLWEAERRCANAIRALYGAAAWRAATSADDPLGYGISEIPTDAETPWGSEVQRKDHCPKSAAVGVKRFVWDGVVVDGLWGTVTGLGMLVGIDGDGWSWETMKTSWVGMGSLIGYSGGEWSWGNAGDAWLELGKGLIAYDTWGDDPARAAGGAVFNVATIFIPAGAAVSGTKGAATAAGTGARVSSWLQKGARIVDFTDPVALTVRGAKVAMPHLDDLASGLVNLTRGIDVPDFSSTLDDLAGRGVDDLARGVDDVADVPPVRDPDTLAGAPRGETPTGTGTGPDAAPAPVREPVPAGVAAADAPAPARAPEAPVSSAPGHAAAHPAAAGPTPEVPAPSTPGGGTSHAPGGTAPTSGPGSTAPTSPGGVGHGADDLLRDPRPSVGDGTGARPDGGGAVEGGATRTAGEATGPAADDVAPGRAADGGTTAGQGDGLGTARGEAADTAGRPTGSEGGGEAAPDAPRATDETPSGGGGDRPGGDVPARVYGLADGSEHATRFAPEQLDTSRTAQHVIDEMLGDPDLFARHGETSWTREHLVEVVHTPVSELTASQKAVLREIADALPPPGAGDAVQKVITQDQANALLDPLTSGSERARTIGGSITKIEDTAVLDDVTSLQHGLRLDYDDVTFLPHDESVFVLRADLPEDVAEVSRFSEMGGTGRTDGWHDPYTGNGFLKSEHLIPEYRIDRKPPVELAPGTELWEVLQDGTQRLAAVLHVDGWVPVR